MARFNASKSRFKGDASAVGGYSCTLTFASGTNPDLAMVNVQNAVKRAEPLLPSEVQRTGEDVATVVGIALPPAYFALFSRHPKL